MVILPGITSSKTRNPPKELLFRWEIPVPALGKNRINGYSTGNHKFTDKESTEGIFIPLGITNLWTRNPRQEWLFRW
jgi:hypothetical protein